MSKKQNIRWVIAAIVSFIVTLTLYIQYDIEYKKTVETDVPSPSIAEESRKKQVVLSSDYVDTKISEFSEPQKSQTEDNTEAKDTETKEYSTKTEAEAAQPIEEKIELDVKLKAEDIYNIDLMEENNIEPLDIESYKNTANVIDSTLTEFAVNSSEISLAYYDFHNGEHYYINGDAFMTAASVSKVNLAALYIDQLEAGEIQLSSELAYSDSLFEAGDGKVTNQETKSAYTVEELLTEAIIRSDNTAMNILKKSYEDEHGNYRKAVLDFVGLDPNSDSYEEYLNSNVTSAQLIEQVLIKIASDDTYNGLIELMTQTSPTQLFTRYVNGEMMANKFGRYSNSVNDCGVYYENGQPQYALVVLTDNVENADNFLETMNLRVNQWFRHKYL
ncbi:serine hydrolase [Aerococcaceae bacterium WGS1372]